MPAPSAAVVISHRIGMGAADPYVNELIRLGYAVNVYCLDAFDDLARTLWTDPAVAIVEPGLLPTPKWVPLYRRCAFTLSGLQPGLNPDQRQTWAHRSVAGRGARRFTRWVFSRFDAKAVNGWLSRLARAARSPFVEDVVFVITTSTKPWLHAAGDAKTISVVESWDHPVRKTAGYHSDVVIAWNDEIGDDWVRFQGSDAVFVGGPWKLAYAIEAFPVTQESGNSGVRRLMYAVGTSSEAAEWYAAERRLIELVAEAAADAGWAVTLKLKPNGGHSDFADIAERHEHVTMTSEESSPNPMDYHLGYDYNQVRLNELSKVDLVVNAVTTFALDAACAGVPVLQLSGFEGQDLVGLRSASRNYHLQTYLLNDAEQVLSVDSANMRASLSAWLNNPDNRAADYSERVRDWLVPSSGMAATLQDAVASALTCVGLSTPPAATAPAQPR